MSILSSRTAARIALGVLASLLMAPFVLGIHQEQLYFDKLKRSGVTVEGQVSAKECADHGRIRYRFAVGGQTYNGFQSCPVGCGTVQVGDPIRITYLPSNPWMSECRDVSRHQEGILDYFGPLLCMGFAALVIFRYTSTKGMRELMHAGDDFKL